MDIKALNNGLPTQEENLDSMINELVEREEFTGGGGGGCQEVVCPNGFTW